MLEIKIPSFELYDEGKNLFVNIKGRTLSLEHSLVSLSKWEAIWHEPFLSALKSEEGLSANKMLSYIKCMTIGKVDDVIYAGLNDIHIRIINEYINEPMTATTFSNNFPVRGRGDILTAEILYYQMIMYGIPFECQKWHLNRLLTLLRVCSIKNAPQKKMSKAETAMKFDEINRQRLAKSAEAKKG